MLTIIKATSSDRLTEIRESINHITTLVPPPPTAVPRFVNNLKGQIFVQLYAVIEHTLCNSIQESINYINGQNLKLNDIKHSLWSLALNSELDSLIRVISKKWDKRWELTEKINADITCAISNAIIPTDGKNFGFNQIESVYKTFSITNPIFHNVTFRGRLIEIIGHRNKIAHGEIAASDIGNRVTATDLINRHNEVSAFCSYTISIFETYLMNKEYLK